VVVSVHWGNEYQRQPTKRQRDIAKRLVEAGCDLVLGHHPHVLQPAEIVEAGGRKALVAYSLGNFISNQDRMYRADLFPVAGGDSRDGAALQAVFEQRQGADGRPYLALAETSFEPLWTENNWGAPAAQREIRVIRVAAAEARVRAEVEALSAPQTGQGAPGHRTALLEKQEYLRTLILRRRRIAEALGEAFVR
jgi:poly-gamma-glutamate synthesis protein (capsule biosynthesis protein)